MPPSTFNHDGNQKIKAHPTTMGASPVGVNHRRRFDPRNGIATSTDSIVTSDLEGNSPSKGQKSGNDSSNGITESTYTPPYRNVNGCTLFDDYG
jgi:hypothetical protein